MNKDFNNWDILVSHQTYEVSTICFIKKKILSNLLLKTDDYNYAQDSIFSYKNNLKLNTITKWYALFDYEFCGVISEPYKTIFGDCFDLLPLDNFLDYKILENYKYPTKIIKIKEYYYDIFNNNIKTFINKDIKGIIWEKNQDKRFLYYESNINRLSKYLYLDLSNLYFLDSYIEIQGFFDLDEYSKNDFFTDIKIEDI